MSEPLVSVVIPLYNAARWVRATLNSVVAQSLARDQIEIVVVNDGSTDDGPAIARETLRDLDLVGVVADQANGGASAARTQGLRLARGVYVQYLDADDLLRPDALRLKVAALERSGADVAYSDWQRWTEVAGRFVAGAQMSNRIDAWGDDLELAAFSRFWAPPASLLFRRAFARTRTAWHPGLPVIQDARYLQDSARAGACFVHVCGVLADYRDHRDTSLSKRDTGAFVRDVFRNGTETEARWRAEDALTPERRDALARCYDYCAGTLFWLGRTNFDEAVARTRALSCAPCRAVRRLAAQVEVIGWTGARALNLPRRYYTFSVRGGRVIARRIVVGLRRPAALKEP